MPFLTLPREERERGTGARLGERPEEYLGPSSSTFLTSTARLARPGTEIPRRAARSQSSEVSVRGAPCPPTLPPPGPHSVVDS